jgi:hypothetical protein
METSKGFYMPGIEHVGDDGFVKDPANQQLVNAITAPEHQLADFLRDAANDVAAIDSDPNLSPAGRLLEIERRVTERAGGVAKIKAGVMQHVASAQKAQEADEREMFANLKPARPEQAEEVRGWYDRQSPEQKVALIRNNLNAVKSGNAPVARGFLATILDGPAIFGLLADDSREEVKDVLAKATRPDLHRRWKARGLAIQLSHERWNILDREIAKFIANKGGPRRA